MIDKELYEILDALTRETGEGMLPCQELELLGFDPFGHRIEARCYTLNLGEVEEEEGVDYDDYNTDDDGNVEEEYEFDEDDEEYSLLTEVLRLNNCRKKYFA
ncbi:MAG: hypothetical protein IIW77_03800 [Bacteroidaceae bacterium]|nr:hypothetical protein [Bacteroidaceae bacterium]